MRILISPLLSLCIAASGHAATTFITNLSPKTLASNEGDGLPLDGAGAGATRTLTLSTDDGGGTIDMTFIRVQSDIAGNSGNVTIGMDADSMGIANDKWGDPSQGMEFSFDQDINFLGMEFISGSTAITLESTAWGLDADGQTGTGWTFSSNGTTGTLRIQGAGNYDFSTGTFSTVAADTAMIMRRNSGGSSGIGMASFTIDVIPEPSAALFGGLGALLLLRRRR
ncbi:MAG: hypothetical protein ACO3SO_07350 [Luteolibacter sp.]